MKNTAPMLLVFFFTLLAVRPVAADAPISPATAECIDCHATFHPGIVEAWRNSRHAQITPGEAMKVNGPARKVSSLDVSTGLRDVAVGCAECHAQRNDAHADTFEHNGFKIHVVVTPDDCATCHAEERRQFSKNLMAHARGNLVNNTLYEDLQRATLGPVTQTGGNLVFGPPDDATRADACIYCHGSRLTVTGSETRDTDAGMMTFPVIDGWPNQGVGRVNPDGSMGSCTACHPRHSFSIETARKPETCRECHIGPDVPTYKVYAASKHGNIYAAMKGHWNFTNVPWTVGTDFKAPTCATCHISLITNSDGDVLAQRTHQITDRLATRIFGLIYAHPEPRSPDTSVIRTPSGLPLPTDFDGKPASEFLIEKDQMAERTKRMQAVCFGCHDRSWVAGHWKKFNHTIDETNAATRVATGIMEDIWHDNFASGLAQKSNPFDEAIERRWTDVWLIDANTIRFSSAMAGGGDYGTFANGRYELSRRIADLHAWYEQARALRQLQVRTGK